MKMLGGTYGEGTITYLSYDRSLQIIAKNAWLPKTRKISEITNFEDVNNQTSGSIGKAGIGAAAGFLLAGPLAGVIGMAMGASGGTSTQFVFGIGFSNGDAIMSIISAGTADANRCGTISLGRHRNSTVGGTPTIVQDGDALGAVMFSAGDGTDMRTAGAKIHAEVDGTPGSNDMPGALVFSTTPDGSSTPYNQEALRIDSRKSFQFSNGFMNETVKINTTARTGTQAVNLDDGMVHYFSTNSSGTWKPNFTMSAGDDINATIATGDVFSPTMIVAKGATSHYATTIQVDGSDVTPEFSGGAPSDGGGSGTFDVYNYTIIKTGDDTFKAFASVSTYE